MLLQPPLTPHTALLWLTPSAVLIVGVVTLVMARRRRMAGAIGRTGAAEPALTAVEEERLARLFGPQGGESARDANR